MFFGSSVTSLPDGNTLESVVTGLGMFQNASALTTLSVDLTLNDLENGNAMFLGTSITTIPNGVVLPNLTSAQTMFQGCGALTSPNNIVIPATTTTTRRMFRLCNSLTTSLKSGNTLSGVVDGRQMFENTGITSMPSTVTLASLNLGLNMFLGVTINTTDYSQLINNIDTK